jgi:hypothetical protein
MTFKLIGIYVFLLMFAYSLSAKAESLQKPSADWIEFDRVEEGTLYFRTKTSNPNATAAKLAPPKPLKSGLFELNYLGDLRPPTGLPYFVFTGKPCLNCMEEQSVYILRPNAFEKPLSFVYPGKIFDPKTRAILLESRAFYGKCLPRHGDIYVIFQKEKVDRRSHLQTSVLIAEAAPEHLTETLLERHLPQIKTTLQFVKKKTCKEIEGRKRLMLRKPLDLHPKNVNDQDDDEDDQTNKDLEANDNAAGLDTLKGETSPFPASAAIAAPLGKDD